MTDLKVYIKLIEMSVYDAIRVDKIATRKMKYNLVFVMHYMYSGIAYTI